MKELQPLVTDIELSKLLKKANVKHYGSLYWYYNDKKEVHFWEVMYLPWLVENHKLELYPAYTAQDLVNSLPDENIWFKKNGSYTNIKTKNDSLIVMNDTNLASFLARVVLQLKSKEN